MLSQHFGHALILNIYFQILFLDSAYPDHSDGTNRSFLMKASPSAKLSRPARSITWCVVQYLERQAL
jgi:hypothetical protein